MWLYVRGVLLSLATILPITSGAKVVGLFDFDGTLTHDRGSGPGWVTPWILKRVEEMHTTYQQYADGPIDVTLTSQPQIEYYNSRNSTHAPINQPARVKLRMPEQILISYDEYYRYQLMFAKGEGYLGSLTPVLLDYDPMFPERELLIVPGYYRTFDLTFKYYREGTGARPSNYLNRDFRSALERTRRLGDGFSWKGKAFPLFQSLMASPETVQDVQIFTSRGQSSREHRAFWRSLASTGEIAHVRGPEGQWPIVHALGSPESRIYGRTLSEKKVDVVRNVLNSLYHSAGSKHLELNKNGKIARTHTLIVAEDEPSYVDAIANYLFEMSGGYYADRVKVVLFNTGQDEEIPHARFPNRWTVFLPGRQARPAYETEIQQWHNPAWLKKSRQPDCETLLETI
jgi:hypothetical protein